MSAYTKEWHRANVGTTEPALCGETPPDGRPWMAAPTRAGSNVLPACQKCKELHEARLRSGVWLAA